MEAATPYRSSTSSSLDLGDPSTVGRLFARVRRLADLSQRELAARVGVSQSTIARVEAGLGLPSLALLARVLGTGGVEVTLHDPSGREVVPVPADLVRDNQGRRFPAHLDVAPPDEVPYERWAYPRYDRPEARAWYTQRKTRDRAGAAGAAGRVVERPENHPTTGELALRERLMRGPQPRVGPAPEPDVVCTCPDACFEELCTAGCTCRCEPPRDPFGRPRDLPVP